MHEQIGKNRVEPFCSPPHPNLLPPGEKGLFAPSPLKGEGWGEGGLIMFLSYFLAEIKRQFLIKGKLSGGRIKRLVDAQVSQHMFDITAGFRVGDGFYEYILVA